MILIYLYIRDPYTRRYTDSHCEDKAVMTPCYLYNGDPYTCKTVSQNDLKTPDLSLVASRLRLIWQVVLRFSELSESHH